jgi:hypothetical protein
LAKNFKNILTVQDYKQFKILLNKGFVFIFDYVNDDNHPGGHYCFCPGKKNKGYVLVNADKYKLLSVRNEQWLKEIFRKQATMVYAVDPKENIS